MTKKLILFEHALGYALIKVKATDVQSIVDLASTTLNDASSFIKMFKLSAFSPFASSAIALQNCNCVSEGVLHENLKQFLTDNIPLDHHIFLGVSDRKLADAIKNPSAGFSDNLICSWESALSEVFRALRFHFPTYIKELSHFAEHKAQIGLGHSYSRAKVKFNINRDDNMIIQSINLLDQLDKDVNAFCMRIKEWFSYHFPELVKIVPDGVTFAKVVGLIGTRLGASENNIGALEDLVGSEKALMIIDAAKSSFGFDITEDDSENLSEFTLKILSLVTRRKQLQDYLASKLSGVAPNLSTLIGDRVCARLISHAGSLMNLAKFPASTIQILGAEKALFRALRCRGKTPKYGLIFHSPFITRASKQYKGRISRFLAAKCAIASRVDCFSEILCDIYGKHLKKQIEDRLKYFETGEIALTNCEAMAIANSEVHTYIQKMKKKAIKVLQQRTNDLASGDASTPSKKKKKTKKKLENGESASNDAISLPPCPVNEEILNTSVSKRAKKRSSSKSADPEEVDSLKRSLPECFADGTETVAASPVVKKKKRKLDLSRSTEVSDGL